MRPETVPESPARQSRADSAPAGIQGSAPPVVPNGYSSTLTRTACAHALGARAAAPVPEFLMSAASGWRGPPRPGPPRTGDDLVKITAPVHYGATPVL